MTVLTCIAVYNKSVSVFYLLYLFWWDELLKTSFDLLKYVSKKQELNLPKSSLINIRTRFFFLMIYIVFIVVIFGFVIDWKNNDLVINNVAVLLFKNTLFNFSLVTFLCREVYLYFREENLFIGHHILSQGIITLHLSLIFGILLWFFLTQKIQLFEAYASIIALIPFLLIKLYFEVREIQHNQKKRLSLLKAK
ncbi:hypothetical protein [uncultured Psychroserpens sp.]|uniref:hypothetical protein n=1 Tax=uncultured Psychroserpens sp. TaxID=255436 RepID=UPI0026273140|nr:hypothetical protein [uncultured Psychroserpens sp.]